ncbi:eukaryotic translation initiation factor 3 subunit J [Mycotypha africana]|uniref:eukaryotic translation initiation factor 3 subunit J n=1 Tax=Mycotypha africana TaxID=64632 RepID=UPI0022FFC7A5|nr:eukaryotic translation initiation factor 3 subunit J [Mycotypha africana]KAI8984485.1 eukaryotic translation initiation factor 3 subunit J [Mycotypha africana]
MNVFIEEEFDKEEVVISNRPKMAWDDEEESDDDNNKKNTVKESWDDSGDEWDDEEKDGGVFEDDLFSAAAPKKAAATTTTAPAKKMTLKQKIAEKEAKLQEQKAKKIALANRFLDGETEEERFERAQKEAGLHKSEGDENGEEVEVKKKEPSKPVASCKPRTQKEFEEFKKLLVDLILDQKNNASYASFVEAFAKDLAQPMKDMDIRKAASSLTALANDKQRQQKEALKSNKKGKGKTAAAPAKKAAPAPTREYSTTYDDFDDSLGEGLSISIL